MVKLATPGRTSEERIDALAERQLAVESPLTEDALVMGNAGKSRAVERGCWMAERYRSSCSSARFCELTMPVDDRTAREQR